MATVIVQNWQKNKYTFSDGSPIPSPPATLQTLKWMPGDVVSSVETVVERTIPRIVGVVDVLNRTRFGTTSRGAPLYIMYPVDVSYPPFLIALKTKPATNVFVKVKYEHWDGIWPRASLEKLIGPVGDLNSELSAMIQTLPPLPSGTGTEPATTTSHAIQDWDVVLHIDPPGCKDVDDILCWKRRDNNIVFGIGIADVAHWIPEGSEIDRAAFDRGATLYHDGTAVEPMLPSLISESVASLRCDSTLRPAVCLVFELIYESGKWKRVAQHWELHMLRVSESYTYDSIHENTERAADARAYLSAVCDNVELSMDSHEWIERAMILYNRTVAEELQRAGVGLLRTHAGTTNEEYVALSMKTGIRELGWLGSAAGTYVHSRENTGHAGLSLACYTHASSPLRRYVDLLNQRWIRALKFGFPAPAPALRSKADPHDLNLQSKRIRRLERDMYFVSRALRSHTESSVSSVSAESDGYLLSQRICPGDVCNSQQWRIYVPDWKRVVTCALLSASATEPGLALAPGDKVSVKAYFDIRQANWCRRMIYQANV
jgi:hypothetical protein